MKYYRRGNEIVSLENVLRIFPITSKQIRIEYKEQDAVAWISFDKKNEIEEILNDIEKILKES